MVYRIKTSLELCPTYQIKATLQSKRCGLECENVEIGVPQGSCLGPLLFLVYINDLPKAVHNSTTSMYADDANLRYKSNDPSRLNQFIYEDV